jgi:hypothetical protein
MESDFGKGAWRGTKKQGKAASSYWASKYDYWSAPKAKKGPQKYEDALYAIARSANVPLNESDESGERQISVAWSDGKKYNSINGDVVYLSPDVIDAEKSRRPKWSEAEQHDVLIADAMSIATLKRTAHKSSEARVYSAPKGAVRDIATKTWTAAELLNAEKEVIRDYPGFADYFAAYRDYWTDADAKQAIEARIGIAKATDKGDPEGCSAALRYEMNYPDDKLTLPEEYREVVDWAKAKMADAEGSKERSEASIEIANLIHRLFRNDDFDDKCQQEQEQQEQERANSDAKGGGERERREREKKRKDGKDKKDKDGDKKGDKGEKGDKDGDGEGDKDGEGKGKGRPDSDGDGLPDLPSTGGGHESLKDMVAADDPDADANPVRMGDTPAMGAIRNENTWRDGLVNYNVKASDADKVDFEAAQRRLSPQINALKNRLKLRNETPDLMEHGLRRGNLDEGSLFKLSFGGEDSRAVFEERCIVNKPKISFNILVDESGSMCGRIGAARDVAIALACSLKGVEGVRLSVLGHTGQGYYHGGTTRQMVLHHYSTPDNNQLPAMIKMKAFSENLDGYAMLETCRHIQRWFHDVPDRYLFVVSDGMPAGSGYGGEEAMRHMSGVCKAARTSGIKIFGVGIEGAYSNEDGKRMYGEGNFVVLKSVSEMGSVLGNAITRVVKESCVLQG